jgi:hypothetical protein
MSSLRTVKKEQSIRYHLTDEQRPKIPEAVEQQAMEGAAGVEAQADGRVL